MKGNHDSSKFFSFFSKFWRHFIVIRFCSEKKNSWKQLAFLCFLVIDWIASSSKSAILLTSFTTNKSVRDLKLIFWKTLSNHSLNSCFELKNYLGNTRVNLYVKLVWSYHNITNFVARKNFQVIFIHPPQPSTWFTVWTF